VLEALEDLAAEELEEIKLLLLVQVKTEQQILEVELEVELHQVDQTIVLALAVQE
jgi:hypothetical protein